MRRSTYRRLASVLCIALVCLGGPARGGLDGQPGVLDDRAREVLLPRPAERIITLAPHATELVFAAGAGHKIVGTSTYSDYPAAAASIPRIGDYSLLDRERLLALRPDLVIAWPSGNRASDLAWLEKRHIPVFLSEPADLRDIATNLRRIGRLAGTQPAADTAARDYLQRLDALRARYLDAPALRVFYQVWPKPLITVGAEHFITQALALCGARPVFAELTTAAPAVTREAVIGADPDAIVAGVDEPSGDNDPFHLWRRWHSLRAVRDDRLIRVSSDLMNRPTPRLLQGAAQVCADLNRRGAAPAHQ